MSSNRIEKMLAPIDSALIKIGRLTLAHPIQSIILLLVAIAITMGSHAIWQTLPTNISVQEATSVDLPLPQDQPLAPLDQFVAAMVDPSTTLPASLSDADATNAAKITPQIETPAKSSKAANTAVANPKTTQATTPAVTYLSGRVTRSLSASARKAGFSAKQVDQLVQLFSQKNLAQQVRTGDEFSALYQTTLAKKSKKAAKAQPVSNTNIIAAQLTIRGKPYQLIRFVDPTGRADYYTPNGYSLHDALSRQPLHFTYISSYFSSNRLDPVLHYHRPHEGVDFAAPLGTPIQAAGDGVLKEVGYKNGYGRTVTIQHDAQYTTRYAHLSRFASNIGEGQAVKRGQIIGYVGQSGFATGPHLHYEIRINDVAANPLTVALPGASIPAAYRGQFLAQSRVLLAQLNTKRQVWLAQRKSETNSLKRSG